MSSESFYFSDTQAGFSSVHNLAGFVLDQSPAEDVPLGYHSAFIYIINVRMGDSGNSGLLTLVHTDRFSHAELKEMVETSVGVVVEKYVYERRAGLRIKPHMDLDEANRQYFENDLALVEAVLCDKYDFRKVLPEVASGVLPATINQ